MVCQAKRASFEATYLWFRLVGQILEELDAHIRHGCCFALTRPCAEGGAKNEERQFVDDFRRYDQLDAR